MNATPPNPPLTFAELDANSLAALQQRIAADNRVVFDIKLHSVGVTNDPSHIAEDYVHASFFAENISKHCSSIDASPINLKYGGLLIRFTLTVSDPVGFVRELQRLQPWFDSENHEPDQAIRDAVADFADHFLDANLRVPELGDNYLANFLAGSEYYENRRKWNRKHPTWRWGFYRSFAADQLKCEIYSSNMLEGAWIVVGGCQVVERMLREYGGFSAEGSKLYDATSLHLDRHAHVLVTPQIVMQVPTSRIGKGVACWRRCIAPKLAHSYNVLFDFPESREPRPPPRPRMPADVEAMNAEFHERFVRFEQKRRGGWAHRYGFTWAMTESGDALVCGDDQVNFVAFTSTADRLRPEVVRELLTSTEHVADSLRDHAGLKAAEQLNWGAVTPEQFEDLCYDVILRSGRFDEKTIRKHGKTRSRDGGRDIEVWTLPRLQEPPVKWIFQCKFITSGKSLAGSKVTVADVIDQYDAAGFGVMTNEVIDSTLYDKLDAVTSRRGVGLDTWDGRRLQRFLTSRPDLMQRYFPIRR